MDEYQQFTSDLIAAGFDVENYNVYSYDERPAVRAYGVTALQSVIRATTVIVTWDSLGMGWIVYPASRAATPSSA